MERRERETKLEMSGVVYLLLLRFLKRASTLKQETGGEHQCWI